MTDGNERPHNCKVRYVDDDKECGTCHKNISDGYFLERGNGSNTICVDCLMIAINENRLVIVDPTKETGLHCHKCNARFTLADTIVQRGTTGAVYCIKCGFAPKKTEEGVMCGNHDIFCMTCGNQFGKQPGDPELGRIELAGPICKQCALEIDRSASPEAQKQNPEYCPKCGARLGNLHDLKSRESYCGCPKCGWRGRRY